MHQQLDRNKSSLDNKKKKTREKKRRKKPLTLNSFLQFGMHQAWNPIS